MSKNSYQRWSRGHKARGQGHKKTPRTGPKTALPRTDPPEAKDRNVRGQGQGPRTQAQVLSKKKDLQNFFSGDVKKKVFKNFFQAFSSKKRLPKFFSDNLKNFKKKLLSSSREQANFRRLEAPRPRT